MRDVTEVRWGGGRREEGEIFCYDEIPSLPVSSVVQERPGRDLDSISITQAASLLSHINTMVKHRTYQPQQSASSSVANTDITSQLNWQFFFFGKLFQTNTVISLNVRQNVENPSIFGIILTCA